MKGLLLKDWYLGKKMLIAALFIIIIFDVAAVISDNNFFTVYPTVLAGMMPVTLISYDEKSSWSSYSLTMPYTRAQIVSAKYILTVIILAASVIFLGIGLALRIGISGNFNHNNVFAALGLIAASGAVLPGIMLPVIFKLGADRGRLVYFIIIVAISWGLSYVMEINERINFNISAHTFGALLILTSLIIMAVSWRLSIMFYEKRDF